MEHAACEAECQVSTSYSFGGKHYLVPSKLRRGPRVMASPMNRSYTMRSVLRVTGVFCVVFCVAPTGGHLEFLGARAYNLVGCDICHRHQPPLVCLCFFPGVFLGSRVTRARPVTTDLIMREQQQLLYQVPGTRYTAWYRSVS